MNKINDILDKGAMGECISVHDATFLFEHATQGEAWERLCQVADKRRQAIVGDDITYVVNRNLNFTNVCVYDCKFCSFAESLRSEAAKVESIDALLAKAQDAFALGATELCIQGGINPKLGAHIYEEILVALKSHFPTLHLHAYSPFEVWYGAKRNTQSFSDYLKRLHACGLDSMPGTAAEILDDEIRGKIAAQKLTTAEWVDIIKTAHRQGIPSSATIMFGHIETAWHRARHLEIIRDIQCETGGFTEFVPLPFVHTKTPLYRMGMVKTLLSAEERLCIYPIARLFFQELIPNIQVSWPKLGYKACLVGLRSGANDFGGTLMEESISKAAGARFGDYTCVDTFRRLIRHIARIPRERTTTYQKIQTKEPHYVDCDADAPCPEGRYYTGDDRCRDTREARA